MLTIKVGKASLDKGIDSLNRFAGTNEMDAKKIIKGAIESAIDQTMETLTGNDLLPTTISEQRVEIMNRVCTDLKRPLRLLEIQTLFRITPGAAKSLESRMKSTFPNSLHDQYLSVMRSDATSSDTQPSPNKFCWLITFSKLSNYNTAVDEVERLGYLRHITPNSRSRTIEFEQIIQVGNSTVDLKKKLGIN